jgi:hypothetical protein
MARPVKDKTVLPMPFGEALERLVGIKPKEVDEQIATTKRAKARIKYPRPKPKGSA